MIELSVLDTIMGAAFTALAYRAGERRERRRAEQDPSKPVCGCKHHRSMHGEDGTCHQRVGEDWSHAKHQYVHRICPCQRYTGPEPLPGFFA